MALGGISRGRRRRHLNAEVNIINLVDVVLVLLIIFMVTAPMMQSGIDVSLPKADVQSVTITDNDLIVELLQNGQVRVGGQKMSSAEFTRSLPLVVAAKGSKRVFIGGDAKADLQTLLTVLAAIKSAGLPSSMLADPSRAQ